MQSTRIAFTHSVSLNLTKTVMPWQDGWDKDK